MRNVIILGSGRSGTSMTAGVLAGAGYFMGHKPTTGRINNPYGNFEDQEINRLNERFLEQVIPGPEIVNGMLCHPDRPRENQRWLARLPVNTVIPPIAELIPTIQELTSHQPYCFKDPRFSYTLPVWRPYLIDPIFLCIFREPHKTVQSIIKQLHEAPHLRGLIMDAETVLEAWCLMYRHILEVHRRHGQWIFLHYDQIISAEGIKRLTQITGTRLADTFPKPELRKVYLKTSVTYAALEIYGSLCDVAEFDPL
jgi:hypothetical protein